MMESSEDPPPLPARSDLDLLVDENFLPVAIQDTAPSALVLKLKGWDPTGWVDGKIFYSETSSEDSAIHPLPASTINEYWDARYPSPFTRVSGPDWRANCADYAIGQVFEDVGPAKSFLASSWTNRGNYTNEESLTEILTGLGDGAYVAQAANHFLKVTIGSAGVTLSQKDGESGVYEATMTRSAAATYICGKASSGIIYQRP